MRNRAFSGMFEAGTAWMARLSESFLMPFNRFFRDEQVETYYDLAFVILHEAHDRRRYRFTGYYLTDIDLDEMMDTRELATV
jgi:hypothetical protein